VHFASMLSKDECERASKFRFVRDQHRFIVARGILRILLSQYLKCKPKDIEIVYGLWGKPALLEENQLRCIFQPKVAGDYNSKLLVITIQDCWRLQFKVVADYNLKLPRIAI